MSEFILKESVALNLEKSCCKKVLEKWGISWSAEISSMADHVHSTGRGELQACPFPCRYEDGAVILNSANGEVLLNYTGSPELVDADWMFLYSGTVGSALSEYASSGELEKIAVVVTALGEIQERVFCLVEEWAERRGLGVGSLLSPGSADGLSIEESIKIGQLLNSADIGVNVSPEGYLSPDYSIIGMVPVDKNFKEKKVTFLCYLCKNWSSCPLSRTRDERYVK